MTKRTYNIMCSINRAINVGLLCSCVTTLLVWAITKQWYPSSAAIPALILAANLLFISIVERIHYG